MHNKFRNLVGGKKCKKARIGNHEQAAGWRSSVDEAAGVAKIAEAAREMVPTERPAMKRPLGEGTSTKRPLRWNSKNFHMRHRVMRFFFAFASKTR